MRALRLIVIPVAVFGLTGGRCGSGTEEIVANPGDTSIEILKRNFDTENIHIFSRGEDFPCCQVAPGETNDDTVILASEGERIEFSAGRLNNRFATVTCTVSERLANEPPQADATVEFRLDQSLRCIGW
jgi:hypothetical protein